MTSMAHRPQRERSEEGGEGQRESPGPRPCSGARVGHAGCSATPAMAPRLGFGQVRRPARWMRRARTALGILTLHDRSVQWRLLSKIAAQARRRLAVRRWVPTVPAGWTLAPVAQRITALHEDARAKAIEPLLVEIANGMDSRVSHWSSAKKSDLAARIRSLGRLEVSALHRRDEGELILRWNYLYGGAWERSEHAVLTRIVGNDLPGHHEPDEALRSLRTILAEEPRFRSLRREWIVNRIVDDSMRARIITVLEEAGEQFIVIPFSADEYRRVSLLDDGAPDVEQSLSNEESIRLANHRSRYRSVYVFNCNGARNSAIDLAMGRASWSLPWDGACLLTPTAWEQIEEGLRDRPCVPVAVVPMARRENLEDLRDGVSTHARDEPQVIVRTDAGIRFDPGRPYGRRSKVELLRRVGVPGPWDTWLDDPWEVPMPPKGNPVLHQSLGRVERLPSNVRGGIVSRAMRARDRNVAIAEFIESVDRSVR